MKKWMLTMLACMMALGMMAQQGKFTLTGTVKDLSMAYHALTDARGEASSDGMLFFNAGKVDLSFDMEKVDWQAAVSEYQLPWLNVLGSFDGDDSPVNLYHETATPAYFLISPSGRIAMALGSAEEFRYMCKLLFE